MRPELARLYRETRALHAGITRALMGVEEAIKTASDEADMADIAYALREIADFADHIRKQCNVQQKLAEKMACVLTVCITQSAEPIRTEYCTATPDVRPIVSVPRRSTHPKEFEALMNYLGVPKRLWEGGDHAVVKPHFPGLVDLLAKEQQDGKPLPPGIDPNKVYQDYKLNIRKRKAPDGGELAPELPAASALEETPF